MTKRRQAFTDVSGGGTCRDLPIRYSVFNKNGKHNLCHFGGNTKTSGRGKRRGTEEILKEVLLDGAPGKQGKL